MAGLVATQVFQAETNKNMTVTFRKSVRTWISDKQVSLFSKDNLANGHCFFCVDSQDIPLPTELYKKEGDRYDVKPLDHFEHLLRELTSGDDSSIPIFSKPELGIERSNIPRIIYEVFRNTHDHGRTTPDGKRLSNSIRGVYIKVHPGSTFNSKNQIDKTVNKYSINVAKALSTHDPSTLDFLEISVFDSGPGLAAHRHFKSKANESITTLLDEKRWLQQCFSKFSSGIRSDDNRGFGLNEVQKSITTLHGYLRIRSGRLSLFRDFQFHPYAKEPFFFDTSTEGGAPQDHGHSQGALFTTLIPQRRLA
jgi:hypothetical protein